MHELARAVGNAQEVTRGGRRNLILLRTYVTGEMFAPAYECCSLLRPAVRGENLDDCSDAELMRLFLFAGIWAQFITGQVGEGIRFQKYLDTLESATPNTGRNTTHTLNHERNAVFRVMIGSPKKTRAA